MTSPAQRDYLAAMGIPVWVSRDLVVATNASTQSAESQQTPNQQHSAQSLLDSFDEQQQTTKPTEQPTPATTQSNSQSKSELPQQALSSSTQPHLLRETTTQLVFANGNEAADWLIVGHSPEPYTGVGNEPFAGEAGLLLDNMLRAVKLNNPRADAYFINVLDKPTTDAASNEAAKQALRQLLRDKIAEVKPKIVFIVGQLAAQNLLENEDPLIRLRSQVHTLGDHATPCVVSYYPSYLLLKPSDKRKAWDDLKLAMSTLR